MSNSQTQAEQRNLRRLPCCLEVNASKKSAPIGVVQDLTLDGAFIVTKTPLPPGVVLPLIFQLDGKKEDIRIEAEVVRPTASGMGVRFLRMSGSDSRALRRYVVTLSDAVGARESAQKLIDADSRLIRPITDAKKISALLGASDGTLFLLPAERAVRIEAEVRSVTSTGLMLKCDKTSGLHRGENVVCLYSHSFVSYSYRSQILSVSGADTTIALPSEVCYSERRTGQRIESNSTAIVRVRLPWMAGTETPFQLCEMSTHGMSFKATTGHTFFKEGFSFPEMIVVRDGQETIIADAVVRHATTMVEDDGERWLRIGVSCNVQRGVQNESSETLNVLDAQENLRARVAAVGRNVRSTLSYLYHSKSARAASAQDARGHLVVKFQNRLQQEIVGLLDTTFRPSDGRVRAPLVIVVPGYGSRKETMSALAHTVIDNWRRQNRDIAVMRYDGTNNLGESYKDPGCEGEGKHGLHFNIPGGVEDVLAALRWSKNNKHVEPTSVVIFSVSMGSPAARRALTLPESASVTHWISFMGAADVASATLNGSGNIDISGNYSRGIKSGIISLIGCLFDADFSTELAVRDRLLTLEDARVDMAKIKADVTWFIGKHDAYIDPRNVRDLMSIAAPGKRNVIEVDAGHVPRHSEEALAEFSLITRHLWKIFYDKEIQATTPSRGWLAACSKREWDRVRKGLSTDAVSYWKDYLVGENNIGFDAWSYTQEYQQLIVDQTKLIMSKGPKNILDLGAGTGNMSHSLIQAGVPSVTAVDLVPEALERVKRKVNDARLRTLAMSADGSPMIAMLRWINGDLGTLEMLASRLHPDLQEPLARIATAYTPAIHSLLRGALLDAQAVVRQAGLPDSMMPLIQDLSKVSRVIRGLNKLDSIGAGLQMPLNELLSQSRGLPFASHSFDAVICSLVLSYMKYPDDTLYEVNRVMQPGSRLVISSMLPDMDSSKAFVGAVKFVETADLKDLPGDYDRQTLLIALREFADKSSKLVHLEEEGSFKFFSADEMTQLLATAGFENIEVHFSCGQPALAVIATANKARG